MKMKAIKKLTETVWNNNVDEYYSIEAKFFRYGTLAVIFALAKWYCGLSAFIAIIPAIFCSTLVFGLFMNRVRNMAAALFFLVLAMGYFNIAPVLLKGKNKFSFLNPEYLTGVGGWLIWFFIALVILGIATFIGYKFFNFQLSQPFHHKVLYAVLVIGWGTYYAFAGSWLLLAGWICGQDVLGILEFLLIAGMIIALFKAKSKAVNISWDLSIARNPFAVFFENDRTAIQDALPSALKNERDIPAMLTLAMKYAQCNGVMRNPQQCIRWCNKILEYLEGSSPEASLFNIKNMNLEKYLAHMLLYIVYSRSTEYKNIKKAETHKKLFDHSLIDISNYWQYWSDATCPFEDISEYRFWGLPYKKLKKIAQQFPDAYLTLALYCTTLSKKYSKQNPIFQELEDLTNQHMISGIESGSKACADFVKNV